MYQHKYHDIVVPTMIKKLATTLNRDVTLFTCFGGALFDIKDYSKVLDYVPCGHKITLSKHGVLPAIEKAMQCG